MVDRRDRFSRDVTRMLVTFGAVIVIDFVVLSIFTGQLRFWFPVWLDPEWESRSAPWVTYSQSYFSGVFFIPLLAWVVDRDLVGARGGGIRGVYWGVLGAAFAFVAWWKGGLMVEYGKHREAVAWLALTLTLFGVVWAAQVAPARLAALSRQELLRRMLLGVGAFFLVMAVVDPLLQIGVHGLDWPAGLLLEVAFFVPVGVAALALARRLRAAPTTQ